MNKKNMISIISAAFFFGAAWGLIEATLGYLLHLLTFLTIGLSGAILFPIGFYFMYKSYDKTKELETVLLVGVIAAIIKLSDFTLLVIHPALTLPVIKIVSPAIFIIFEACSVFFVLFMVKENVAKFNIGHAFITSFSWRLLFIVYQLILFFTGISRQFIDAGALGISRFVFIESTINTIIIFGFMLLLKPEKEKADKNKIIPIFSKHPIHLTISIILFFSTIAVHLLLKLG